MIKSICRIESGSKYCTGSFCKIIHNNQCIRCLLTNKEIINDNYLLDNKSIEVFLNEDKKTKKIAINKDKITYINNLYGVTIIEINDEDDIDEFLELDNNLLENPEDLGIKELEDEEEDYPKDFYRNQPIYIPHYQNNKKVFVSFGTLKDFNDFEIIHFCDISDRGCGPSGAPIIDLESKKIIGIYKHEKKENGERSGIFLELAVKDFIEKNIKKKSQILNRRDTLRQSKIEIIENQIKIILKIEEDMIGQKVYFLDNYTGNENEENVFSHNHLKELNEKNVELEINGKPTKYKKFFYPEQSFNEIIIYFKKPIKDCSYMFYNCSYLDEIDLSAFDTQYVTNMECMFAMCENLKSIDLSFLYTKNVNNMDQIFLSCFNLQKIKLNYLGNDETSMENSFFGCTNLKTLDLSSLDTNDDIDIERFIKKIDNLELIIAKKECKDKFEKYSLNVKYV